MPVFLLRHGKTTGNVEGRIMGRMDTPLMEVGITTARAIATLIAQEKPGVILSSPLGRSLETSKIVSRITSWPVIVCDELAELSCGVWEGCLRKDVLQTGNLLRTSWQEKPPGGESYESSESRVAIAVERIRELQRKGNVAVIGHAGVNRVFMKCWYGLQQSVALEIQHPHEICYILANQRDIIWMDTSGRKGEGFYNVS